MVMGDAELIRQEYKARISSIFREYNPSKLEKVEELLGKYVGKEHSLYMKVCQKYREPKMSKYRPPPREEEEPAVVEVRNREEVSGVFNPSPRGSDLAENNIILEITMEDWLQEAENKITLQAQVIEDMENNLGDAKALIAHLEKEKTEMTWKCLESEVQKEAHMEELRLAKEHIAQLEKERTEMNDRYESINGLRIPSVLTSPCLDNFSAQELHEQEELLCLLLAKISCARNDIREKQEDEKQCRICFSARKNCVFNPCGHGFCQECAGLLEVCAFCKQEKQSVIKIFW